ncbi:MAG: hypothetical protein JW827_08590 [Spirochaetes bacterium]|nr:hypothetical protein [Spirochaetota bacterium]
MPGSYRRAVLFLLFFFVLFGCASKKMLLEKSNDHTPYWIDLSQWEDERYIYFVASSRDEVSSAEGLRKAKELLIKNIQEKMKDWIDSDYADHFSKAGSCRDSEKIKRDLNKITINLLDFENLIPDNSYYEKMSDHDQTYYKCYLYKALSKEIIRSRQKESVETIQTQYTEDKDALKFLTRLGESYK